MFWQNSRKIYLIFDNTGVDFFCLLLITVHLKQTLMVTSLLLVTVSVGF
jgi:hypothetical protein